MRFLIINFILFTFFGCASSRLIWQTLEGEEPSEEIVTAAKEVCDYNDKIADIEKVNEAEISLNHLPDSRTKTLGQDVSQRRARELKNEIERCMKDQGLIQIRVNIE